MKTFKIISHHNVFIDSYEEGEGEEVNYYTEKAEVKAETVNEAIQQYFDETLCYSFDFKHAAIDEENNNVLYYSNLVDAENCEASESEIEKWKQNNLTLYSNTIQIEVYELIQQQITI